jgi:Zn finger protein HypA/HybF involved in hydrogenase expression
LTGELTDCPNCHGIRLKVVTGEEFFIESIEIEAASDLAKATS